MKKILIAQLISSSLFGLNANGAYPLNASDIIEYALTATGIQYILRNDAHTKKFDPHLINRWNFHQQEVSLLRQSSFRPGHGDIPITTIGSTDCSGLVGASLRIKERFYPPSATKSATYTTTGIYDAAHSRFDNELSVIPWRNRKGQLNILPGDAFNKRRTEGVSSYGHTGIFNGRVNWGAISTIEARDPLAGVGPFTYRLADLEQLKSPELYGFQIIRRAGVRNNIGNSNIIIPVRNAKARCSTHPSNSCRRTSQLTGPRLRPAKRPLLLVRPTSRPVQVARQAQVARPVARPTNVPNSANAQFHRVSSGQTGSIIARLYSHLNLASLMRLNPGVQWNRLREKQMLNIGAPNNTLRRAAPVSRPVVRTAPAPSSNQAFFTHRVLRDQTLWRIGHQNGVSVDALINFHFLMTGVRLHASQIREGMVIYIPR